MKDLHLRDLQESVQDTSAFDKLEDYQDLCHEFLRHVKKAKLTRIVSPTHGNYIFFQYGKTYKHAITRPINSDLFIESPADFDKAYARFIVFLEGLRHKHKGVLHQPKNKAYLKSKEINRVVYMHRRVC